MTQKIQKISLIGPGSVGRALLSALGAKGFQFSAIYSRRQSGIITSDGHIEFDTLPDDNPSHYGGESPSGLRLKRGLPTNEQDLGDVLFITTPDDSIQRVANELAQSELNWTSKYVVHCSGSLSSEVLNRLTQAGAVCASFHPMQTFPSTGQNAHEKNLFQNIPIGIEGAPELSKKLSQLALQISARPVILTKRQKQLLHVAAVFISNYNVVLAAIADELLQGELGQEDVHLLDSLLLQTAKNICSTSPHESLTGPVSRGDAETVQQHLGIIKDKPDLYNIYKLLGNKALEITLDKNSMDSKQSDLLKKLLK